MNTSTISEIRTEAPRATQTPAERFHSLDALRAFALLLGVVFHSTMAYVLPPGIWAVGTTEPPPPLLWFIYYAHCFRMEVFFLLAGFFARLVIKKRGEGSFLRDRATRILLVFVLALYPMKLLLGGLWVVGGLKTGWLKLSPEVANLPVLKLAVGGLGMESWPNINLTHLWFLYYLACITGVFVAARWLALRWNFRSASLPRIVDATFRGVTSSWLAPLVVAAIATPFLAMMSGKDVDTPDRSFTWNFPVLFLYGFFFSFGWWLHRQVDLLDVLARRWMVFLSISTVVSVIASIAVGMRYGTDTTGLRWAASFGTSLTMSLAVLGFLGLFVRVFSRPSPWLRYLADSSYWIYLAHLPVVVALQVWLSGWGGPWWIKVLTVNILAFAVLLSSYHLCVRFSWIGGWINGRRPKRSSDVQLWRRASRST